MNPDEEFKLPSINSKSILSLVFGILTLLSFCTGWLPIPFTGIVCLPSSFLLGVTALYFGTVSLNQIRKQNESGRPMAWIGIYIGGLVLLCMICMLAAIAAFFLSSPESIPTPPFFQNPQM